MTRALSTNFEREEELCPYPQSYVCHLSISEWWLTLGNSFVERSLVENVLTSTILCFFGNKIYQELRSISEVRIITDHGSGRVGFESGGVGLSGRNSWPMFDPSHVWVGSGLVGFWVFSYNFRVELSRVFSEFG
jgi:hypothetical protein